MFSTWQKQVTGRGAALVAMLAMGSILGLVLSAIARDVTSVFSVFIFVFILAFSAWFVLTRGWVGRVLGSLGVLLGISGVIGFLEMHWMWLTLLTGSILVFGITARYAVRRDRELVLSRASENKR